MGEISEMIQDGVLCKECGGYVGDERIKNNGGEVVNDSVVEVPGFPLYCGDCNRSAKAEKYGKRKSVQIR